MPIDLAKELRTAVADLVPELEDRLRRAVREEVHRASRAGDPDELLDANHAAKLLGLTAAALRRAAERGQGVVPCVRGLGRRLRWRRGDILALIETRGAGR